MGELEYLVIKLETLKAQGADHAAKCMRENDEGAYYLWDMFRLEMGSALSRIHDLIELEKEARKCTSRTDSQA